MRIVVKLRHLAIAAGLAAGAISAILAPVSAQGPQGTATNEETSAVIGRMSKTLMGNQFSFRADTLRAYVGANGELLHIGHTLKTVVRRPDKLLVDATGDDGSTKLIYDGKTLVIYNVAQKQYARIPVSGKIEEMLEAAEKRLGIDFPLADLLTANPGESVLAGVTAGGQVGTVTIDGVKSRHFFFIQPPDLDMELWIEDSERALPRRVFVKYRTLPGHPTFFAELSDWNLSVQPTDADFTFQPPAGVTEVELKPRTDAAPASAK